MSRENRGTRICFDSMVLGKIKNSLAAQPITSYQRAVNHIASEPTDEEREICCDGTPKSQSVYEHEVDEPPHACCFPDDADAGQGGG